jgi:hypothetical protein
MRAQKKKKKKSENTHLETSIAVAHCHKSQVYGHFMAFYKTVGL